MLRKDMLADIVPVDIPINLMCCVAWRWETYVIKSVKVLFTSEDKKIVTFWVQLDLRFQHVASIMYC